MSDGSDADGGGGGFDSGMGDDFEPDSTLPRPDDGAEEDGAEEDAPDDAPAAGADQGAPSQGAEREGDGSGPAAVAEEDAPDPSAEESANAEAEEEAPTAAAEAAPEPGAAESAAAAAEEEGATAAEGEAEESAPEPGAAESAAAAAEEEGATAAEGEAAAEEEGPEPGAAESTAAGAEEEGAEEEAPDPGAAESAAGGEGATGAEAAAEGGAPDPSAGESATAAAEEEGAIAEEGAPADGEAAAPPEAPEPPPDAEGGGDASDQEPASPAECLHPSSESPLITEVRRAVQPPRSPRRSVRCFGRDSRYAGSDYTGDELRRLFERVMQTKKCPSVDALLPLRAWIAREMLTVVQGRTYDYGTRLKEGDEMIEAFLNADQSSFARERQRQAAADRCSDVKEQVQETNRAFGERLSGWATRQDVRAEELNRVHDADIADFEARWGDPESLTEFSKPSPRLIMLRTTEKRLAILKQFDRAKRFKTEADKLERVEALEAQRRAIAAMRIEYSNMEAKHTREIEGLEGFTERGKEQIERHRAARVDPLQLVIARLTALAAPAIVRERKKPGVFDDTPWPESPRPVPNGYKVGTSIPPGQKLGLSGIKVRQYIKIKKRETKKPPAAKKKEKTKF
jgi:hypothetical protein